MRGGFLRWVLAAAVLVVAPVLGGCAAGRCCPTAPAPRPCCHREWVPDHTERVLTYERIPAECRYHPAGVYGTCCEVKTVTRQVPVYDEVVVRDTCPILVPRCECRCVPEKGYQVVEDERDRLCPTWEARSVPCTRTQLRASVGTCPLHASVGLCQVPGTAQVWVPGERTHLERVKCGSHLEPVVLGFRREPVQVGSRETQVTTGHHTERVQVGTECVTEVVRGPRHVVQTGVQTVGEVVRPSRLVAKPTEVRVPGYWVVVCDTGAHANDDVLTRAQYQDRCGNRAK